MSTCVNSESLKPSEDSLKYSIDELTKTSKTLEMSLEKLSDTIKESQKKKSNKIQDNIEFYYDVKAKL